MGSGTVEGDSSMVKQDGLTLGAMVGIPVLVAVVLIGLLCWAAGIWMVRTEDLREEGWTLIGGTFIGLVIAGIIFVASWFPFDMTYHHWYRVEGQVESIGMRNIRDGDGMSQRYVFVIGGQPWGVDDTRASVTKTGDFVKLKCKKEWVYQSKSGWACNWNG